LYLDVQLPAGGAFELPPLQAERAVYAVDAALQVGAASLQARQMAVLPQGQAVQIAAGAQAARLVVIGGAPLDGPRHMWWNFVSSRRERIVQAAADWEAQRMGAIEGEADFIPLPERRFVP
ncbi:MAG: pirin-like C-terminal cupin domain-containing protein, partial [Curvibacter sp.]